MSSWDDFGEVEIKKSPYPKIRCHPGVWGGRIKSVNSIWKGAQREAGFRKRQDLELGKIRDYCKVIQAAKRGAAQGRKDFRALTSGPLCE